LGLFSGQWFSGIIRPLNFGSFKFWGDYRMGVSSGHILILLLVPSIQGFSGSHTKMLDDRPHQLGMNITGVTGITEALKAILKALGAIKQ
jgi:hypothetical protein